MAKLNLPKFRRRKKDPVTVYWMRERLYMRAKSSLSREKVLTDPAFAPLRFHAGIMSKASPIASRIYQNYTPRQKKRFSSQFLTGKAMRLLKQGLKENEVEEIMKELYGFRSIIQSGLKEILPAEKEYNAPNNSIFAVSQEVVVTPYFETS